MPKATEQLQQIDEIANHYREQMLLDELRNDGVQITVYFDTYHILPIIQGYWELQKSIFNDIDVRVFKDDMFLVKSLVYFRYIKNLRILLPHAVELKNQLDKTYLLPTDIIDQEKINKFLQSVNLDNLLKLRERAQEKTLGEYLGNLEPHAEDLFKANYVLDKLIWTRRYNHLFEKSYLFDKEPIIEYDSAKYNNADILQSNLFHKLLNALAASRESRKYKTVNNLRDAMALCMFHQKVRQFKKHRQELPLFYVSGGVLAKLDPDLLKEFELVYKKTEVINTLKDTQFFIVDSMFTNKESESEDEMFRKMKTIKESLDVYTQIGEHYPQQNIQLLIKDWAHLRSNDFFKKLWPVIKNSLNDNILALIDVDYLTKNEETVKKIINDDKGKISRQIDSRINELVLLEDIWNEVETFSQVLDERFNQEAYVVFERVDIFRDEGLTRFSPPNGYVQDEIEQLWYGFLENHFNKNQSAYQAVKVKLTRHIYEGFLRGKAPNLDKVLIGLCILYAFHKDELIIRLVTRLNGEFGKYYQILLIYMASLLRLSRKTPKDVQELNDGIVRIESNAGYGRNYKAWLGISYVKFNMWRMRYDRDQRRSASMLDNYLNDCIELAKKVYDYLKLHKDNDDKKNMERNVKYYYSLNNYIYYSLHKQKNIIPSVEFHEYIDELMTVQREGKYSQCRFSDTIAFYYYRRAEKDYALKQKLDDLEIAEIYAKEAVSTSVFKDGRFVQLLQKIKVLKDHLTPKGEGH